MSFNYYTGEGIQPSSRTLPVPNRLSDRDPAHYIADPGLVEAANTAIFLGMPLLLTGEPGTGKTHFAASLAYELRLIGPFVFQAKSTSEARDLFYTFDALSAFRAAQSSAGASKNVDFVSLGALGVAIFASIPPANRQSAIIENRAGATPARAVVLIDEIDKAPRDFPNDILAEIDEMAFRIPEVGGIEMRAAVELRPIVVITSNSERQLPDAFLRRCIYYHIPFPSPDRLAMIVERRLGSTRGNAFIDSALRVFLRIRGSPGISKPPATAELLDWLRALEGKFGKDIDAWSRSPKAIEGTLSALLKTEEDKDIARREIAQWTQEK